MNPLSNEERLRKILFEWSDTLGLYKLSTSTVDNFKEAVLDEFISKEQVKAAIDSCRVYSDKGMQLLEVSAVRKALGIEE